MRSYVEKELRSRATMLSWAYEGKCTEVPRAYGVVKEREMVVEHGKLRSGVKAVVATSSAAASLHFCSAVARWWWGLDLISRQDSPSGLKSFNMR